MKFGGSSVANAENMTKVVSIVTDALRRDKTVLVCSAISKCTDTLIEIGQKAAAKDSSYETLIDALEARHIEIIDSLLPVSAAAGASQECKSLFNQLRNITKGVFLLGELSTNSLAAIESFGELLSTKIIHAKFVAEGISARWVDSREIVKVVSEGVADVEKTYANARKAFSSRALVSLFVAPGFIAYDSNGRAATLGRGGSDYTASLYAAGLGARRLEIWTDVTGMMTSNPKVAPDARTIEHISYRAALELSHFGAKVIYPPTIQPVVAAGIPIYVKNTFAPEAYGTMIEANPPRSGEGNLIGISNSDDIALISLEGSGMVGAPGFSSRFFDALSRSGINIILITQASSVHTMCIAISGKDAEKAKQAADECFAYEISLGKINPLKIETGYSIVCLVGDDVISRSGITGRMLTALGGEGIPVRAVAQGSSERNISAIVASPYVGDAIRCIHTEFFSDNPEKTLNLYVAGYGNVGKSLVKIVEENADLIAQRTGKRLRINRILKGRKEGTDQAFEELCSNVKENAIFVDCTSSAAVCNNYAKLLESGYSIVACNKLLFSAPYHQYKSVKDTAIRSGKALKYETTVGAALPIIETIARCVNSGDRIHKVEAVLSGTLNFLFSNYAGSGFAQLVEEAKRRGYTEADPQVDLSGRDVLRKLLILSREAGIPLEEEDVTLSPIPPEEELQKLYAEATSRGLKLRYVALLEEGKASMKVEAVGPENPLYVLSGTDNAALIYTDDYPSPLVIQGAGAGPRQTAGGLLNDILSI